MSFEGPSQPKPSNDPITQMVNRRNLGEGKCADTAQLSLSPECITMSAEEGRDTKLYDKKIPESFEEQISRKSREMQVRESTETSQRLLPRLLKTQTARLRRP